MTSATPMVEAAALETAWKSVHPFHNPDEYRMAEYTAFVVAYLASATPAPSTPVAEGIVGRLHELIGEYFDLGYAEGVTGRDADTVGGDAQRVWSDIASTIASLSARLAEAVEAEDEAKDCFWAVYPTYCRTVGHGISTEASRTMLVTRASTAEAALATAQEALRNIRELNMSGVDLKGNRWANSDLIEQEIVASLKGDPTP